MEKAQEEIKMRIPEDRVCAECKATETTMHATKHHAEWHSSIVPFIDGWICHKCFMSQYNQIVLGYVRRK